jgi:hypothetical protein
MPKATLSPGEYHVTSLHNYTPLLDVVNNDMNCFRYNQNIQLLIKTKEPLPGETPAQRQTGSETKTIVVPISISVRDMIDQVVTMSAVMACYPKLYPVGMTGIVMTVFSGNCYTSWGGAVVPDGAFFYLKLLFRRRRKTNLQGPEDQQVQWHD